MHAELGGDDLKLVSYWISFVKPGSEAILQRPRSEIIDYATDESTFGRLKLAEFLEDLGRNGIAWPPEWRQPPGDEYSEVGQPIREIPQQDLKYLQFTVCLDNRLPAPHPESD